MTTNTNAKSQKHLCLKSEKVKYDWSRNSYSVFSTMALYDSVIIDKFHIQIKSKEIDLTKRRELSKWSDNAGITTVYETVSSKHKIVNVRVIETSQGISKIVVMESPNSDYGTAYSLMEFQALKIDSLRCLALKQVD